MYHSDKKHYSFDAHKAKNQNESRIRYLEKMIRTAVVITDESKEDEAGLGNVVELYFEDDDETESYYCTMDLDEDEMERFLRSDFGSCPFYRRGDDYATARRQ